MKKSVKSPTILELAVLFCSFIFFYILRLVKCMMPYKERHVAVPFRIYSFRNNLLFHCIHHSIKCQKLHDSNTILFHNCVEKEG